MPRFSRRALLAGLSLPALPVLAAWPERGITWVVPFAAGGAIGAEDVARSPADGHTVRYGSQGPMSAVPAMQPVRYDPIHDFAPVHGVSASRQVLLVPAGRPWRTLGELVAEARARPGALTYASTGVGTSPHLGTELLLNLTGIRMVHAPYANGAQAITDLVGGRIDLMYDYPLSAGAHVRDGRLRALAVTSATRVPSMPDVPTVGEAGFPAAEEIPWAAVFMHAATPAPVVTQLAGAIGEVLRLPAVAEYLASTGSMTLHSMGPAELRRFLAEDVARIRELISRSGATPG